MCVSNHRNRTGNAAMPDDEPHPQSGFCWKILYTAAKIGGNKFGRQFQKMSTKALLERQKNGILE